MKHFALFRLMLISMSATIVLSNCGLATNPIAVEAPTHSEMNALKNMSPLNAESAKRTILYSYKDPESVKLVEFNFMGFGYQGSIDPITDVVDDYHIGYWVHVVANAKNGYGAYSGYKAGDYIIIRGGKNKYGCYPVRPSKSYLFETVIDNSNWVKF